MKHELGPGKIDYNGPLPPLQGRMSSLANAPLQMRTGAEVDTSLADLLVKRAQQVFGEDADVIPAIWCHQAADGIVHKGVLYGSGGQRDAAIYDGRQGTLVVHNPDEGKWFAVYDPHDLSAAQQGTRAYQQHLLAPKIKPNRIRTYE
jgi:hypothetical protein